MKKVVIGSSLVVAYLAFLLALLPARFALQFVELPDSIKVGGVQGTLWTGEIDHVAVEGVMLRQVSWRLRPLQLFSGRGVADIVLAEHPDNLLVGRGRVWASKSSFGVVDLNLEARVTDLLTFAPQPSPLAVRGDVQVQVQRFEWGQPACAELAGQANLQRAAIEVGRNWEELGELQVELQCVDGQVLAQVVEPNRIGLSGSALATLNGAQVEFSLNPGDDAPRSVRNIINMLPAAARQPQQFQLRF